jgi:hypothetical protein
MITAEQLKMLTTRTATELTNTARDSKYKGAAFTAARFLGITNGGQFCYTASFPVKGGVGSTKVFLTFNPAAGKVIADVELTSLA